MINTKVGNKIKEVRMQLNITENKMAEKLEISLQHYFQLECGYSRITVDQLITISLILGVTPQSLILDAKQSSFMNYKDRHLITQNNEIMVSRQSKLA